MPVTAADLVALFDIEPNGPDRFIGRSPPNGWPRVYGGQVIAQALVAATRTVEERTPHSLHAYFLLPGDPAEPILLEVERIRDGRSFTTRRVVARQRGEAIFVLSSSFQIEEQGLDHLFRCPRRLNPNTSSIPSPPSRCSAKRRKSGCGACSSESSRSNSARSTCAIRAARARRRPRARQSLWIRIGGALPDDPAIHRAALAYLSDMTLLDTALVAHGHTISDGRFQLASLDHALWLHRPCRADDWLLYVQDSPNAHGARGLTRGLLYTRAGVLAASVVQEGLMRQPRSNLTI